MCHNLQSELQFLTTEAEKLRQELASQLASRAEAQHRLQLVAPALSEAKRRVRELEEHLEVASSEAAREQQMGERLERETSVCRDKMRALRDENVRLSEQCTEFEAQLQQATAAAQRSASARRPLSAGGATSTRGARGPLSSRPGPGASTPRGGGCGAIAAAPSLGSSCSLRGGGTRPAGAGGSEAPGTSPKGHRTALPRTPRSEASGKLGRSGWAYDTPTLRREGDGSGSGDAPDPGAATKPDFTAPAAQAPMTLEYLRNWIEGEEGRLSACPPIN